MRVAPCARCSRASVLVVGAVCALILTGPAASAQDMPDPALIHGRALPAPELPNGTVTVRVVRENLGNNIAGQEVRLTAGGAAKTARTDELGRAEFTGLPAGEARAETTVDGERLESQPFPVPVTGGVRVLLVSGLAAAAERRKQEEAEAAQAPAVKGTVVFGGNSRVLMQINDDELEVFYVLEVVNNARARVDIGGPLIIELPRRAVSVRTLEGSSPTAQANGTRVTVVGPFASGITSVQVGYSLPHSSSELDFEQAWPAPLQQVTVGVQKVGSLSIASPQFATVTEVRTEGGTPFALGTGPGLQPGTPLRVTISNLPTRSQTPRYVGLGLALAIVAIGVWLIVTAKSSGASERAALVAARDALLDQVAQLEARRRAGDINPEKYSARRQRLVAQLEQVYGELDDADSSSPRGDRGPQGGGEGVAA
jgi:hypothetical protein